MLNSRLILLVAPIASLVSTSLTHAGGQMTHTQEIRTMLGSAQVDSPADPPVLMSDFFNSLSMDDFDETIDLTVVGPPRSKASSSMFVTQQSAATPTAITFSTQIETSMVTPAGFANTTNASTFFQTKFTLSMPTTLRFSGTMDGGADATGPGFITANILVLNAGAQTILHEKVEDGESEEYDQTLSLQPGSYSLMIECHGGLSNLSPQHPQLLDAASLFVDVSMVVVTEGDLDGDGDVDGADLGLLLAAWESSDSVADLTNDGTVDGADLGLLLSAWTL